MAKTAHKAPGRIEEIDGGQSEDRGEAEVTLDNFGMRLLELRKTLELTAPDFAKALELNSPDLLARWENNEVLPSTGTLIRMAKEWGIDLNSLLVGMPSAVIVTELKALREIKAEFRSYRNVVREHITRLQTIDRVVKDLLTKLGAAETKATEKQESLQKGIL